MGQLIIGHRGDASLAPENTMSAFRAACDHGVDVVELDVRRTVDGALVISHDPTVDRCTSGHGRIKDMTLQQIEALDAGSWFGPQFKGEKIPTLGQVLDFAKGRVQVDIHINNDDHEYPGIEQDIVEMVRDKQAVPEVILSSFDRPMMEGLKAANPDFKTGILLHVQPLLNTMKRGTILGLGLGLLTGLACGLGPLAVVGSALLGGGAGLVASHELGLRRLAHEAARLKTDVLLPFWAASSPTMVRLAHLQGQEVIPYTCDSPGLVYHMFGEGADGIISDNPEKFSRGNP